MKIAVCSDVHLEFGPITLENTNGADVLVLSGDICVADDLRTPDPYGIMDSAKLNRFYEFFGAASKNFPNVVYVMGNHEHYHGDFAKSAETLRNFLKDFDNIHFLDKEYVELNEHIFYGGTCWTNFDQGYGPGDTDAMRHIQGMMNDYRGVKNSNRMVTRTVPIYKTDSDGKYVMEKNQYGYDAYVEIGTKKTEHVSTFSPEDSYEDHLAFMQGLTDALESRPEMKFIVCGHHAPSKQSTHPRYKNETMINAAYSSDLSQFILNNQPQIKVWTHGHTHEPFDYMIGTTRIICNPRGYDKYEQRAEDFELQYYEV